MVKKMAYGALALALVAGWCFAEEAKKPAPPKVSLEFSQRMDSEQVNGWIVPASTFGTDALYSRTEFKAGVAYSLGANASVALSFKDRFEARLNPGNIIPVGWSGGAATENAAVEKLGKIRERNRFYGNVDASFKIVPAFNLGLGLEMRLAADLRTDKAGTVGDPTGNVGQEVRTAGSVILSGAFDPLSYSLNQALAFYADTVDNGKDESFDELEGTYALGASFKLGEASLKFDVSEYLLVTNPTKPAKDAGDKATVATALTVKATLSQAGVSPFVAFFLNTSADKTGTTTASVAGGSLGIGLSSGAWSFSGQYDLGFNGKNDNMMESHVTMSVKIKS